MRVESVMSVVAVEKTKPVKSEAVEAKRSYPSAEESSGVGGKAAH